jgi:hypothetical protein
VAAGRHAAPTKGSALSEKEETMKIRRMLFALCILLTGLGMTAQVTVNGS